MTAKSRYFLIGAATVLVVGVGGGSVAYYQYNKEPKASAGLPPELRYVPVGAEVVAYADVHEVMTSEFRRELERMALGSHRNRQDINDFAGIDLEKQVHHVMAYLEPLKDSTAAADRPSEGRRGDAPRGLVFLQGSFEQPRIEQFVRDHGGTIEDYHGKRLAIHDNAEHAGDTSRPPQVEMAVGFLGPDLIALGQADLVRSAVDAPDTASAGAGIMGNAELFKLIQDVSGDTAWVVGRFDTASRRMGIPPSITQQMPPLRLFSAKAHINGGVQATVRAETADPAAADQMRDVLRGFVSLIRLQAGSKPEMQSALKTIELGGTGNTVQISFGMSLETFRAMMPAGRRQPGQPPADRLPAPPPPPAPPVGR